MDEVTKKREKTIQPLLAFSLCCKEQSDTKRGRNSTATFLPFDKKIAWMRTALDFFKSKFSQSCNIFVYKKYNKNEQKEEKSEK